MKIISLLSLLGGLHGAAAHYVFAKLSLNGGPVSHVWQYIRNLTDGYAYSEINGYHGNFVPYYDMYDPNIRCGRGAAAHGPGTETLAVNAGDELAFFSTIRNEYTGVEEDTLISHEGPGQAYLSKSPAELDAYTGDGDWFKIGSVGAFNDTRWALISKPSMNFTIPKTTPPGKYLMRVEHIFSFSSKFNDTQFYVSCAQIDVKGPGGGNPGPLVKFPGAYDVFDHALWVPYHIGAIKAWNLTGYVAPGPSVWSG
ncbi:uncharacterized protein BDR25DRAFT_370629 [Lindgomyces ingoldianus]|uniref:Uncharacterized protein n=1 Tax=Lindgomyces ingoldianus TaxID=673940 RepID=A0ACB6RES0_9PLEO|nr:uncharacterized protein BDR25DRAFT_370629 [Lindgomyces ingoldianus]KAF2476827.1 hypothetical protein BDR25DRAFT_370629 [Lindgomyces ingoldianus]